MLQTERLILRRWQAGDREPFAQINADPEVMAYLPATLTAAESNQLIDKFEEHHRTHGFGCWAVDEKATGHLIGFVGLNIPTFEAHFTPTVEVGWRLARPFWGTGYATEAARAAMQYGFEKFDLPEIVAFTARLNQRSIAVMQRLGMTHDGADDFDHPYLAVDNPLRPHVLYRLRRDRGMGTGDRPVL